MKKVDVYFDFLCPYCKKGILDLVSIMTKSGNLHVNWIPCEAHPRPEVSRQYTDLCSEAYYSTVENGGNGTEFVLKAYDAGLGEGKRIDDPALLTDIAARCGADPEKVSNDLKTRRFNARILENNDIAWEDLGYLAVPDYRAGDRELRSMPGCMISAEELGSFLKDI